MKKRLTYVAPEAELVLVRFEENILSVAENERSLNYNDNGGAGVITGHQNYNEDAF